MKAVILANMGAPYSEKEMKIFLKRMFNDKAIIYAPFGVRKVVSTLISNVRYKSSWKKYELIGGSPLYASMDKTAQELGTVLGSEYRVLCAYSYSAPFIADVYKQIFDEGIREVTVIPMYPQASYSTTGSLISDTEKIRKKFPELKIEFVDDYFEHPLFIEFWTKNIAQKINAELYEKPYLLFSAHAIPESFIKRGDLYAKKMERSAGLIAGALALPYAVSYQSKIGPIAWTKPYTAQYLRILRSEGVDQVVVVPLSFINENLETRYDLDTEIIPEARKISGFKDICRVNIPESDATLVKMFKEFI